jgi:class 3 adenylate cyclase
MAIPIAARGRGVAVRAGLHTGEVELRGDDGAGRAVRIGARVAALADGDATLVSGAVTDSVPGSGPQCEDRGTRNLKRVPGEWRLYAAS